MHVKDMIDWGFYLPAWMLAGEIEIDGVKERKRAEEERMTDRQQTEREQERVVHRSRLLFLPGCQVMFNATDILSTADDAFA